MLLDDAAIEDCFSAIGRIAYMLEHPVLTSQLGGAPLAARASRSQAELQGRRGSKLPLVGSQRGSLAAAAAGAEGWRRGHSVVNSESTDFDLQQPLRLPKQCGAETVALLAGVGHALEAVKAQLQTKVDEKLVAFYDFMKHKEARELSEIASNKLLVPDGFHFYGDENVNEGELYAALGGTISHAPSRPRTGIGFVTDEAAHKCNQGSGSGGAGLASVLPVVVDNGLQSAQPSWATMAMGSTSARSQKGGTHTGALRNAPLARKINERRALANTLQSFLYIIMESAVTQANATCAAVYINGTYSGAAINSSPLGDGSAAPTFPSTTSANASTSAGPLPPSASADDQPRFLHCIAKLNDGGKFPQELSYATMSTLISVVQTGVAVNLRSSDRAQTLAAAAAGGVPGEDSGRHGGVARKHLHIINGVIVPIKTFGCIVIGDKSAASGNGSFTLFDEHVAWSAALLCEAMLTRYKRELLLEFPWAPSGVSLLRRYMLVNHGTVVPVAVRSTGAQGRSDSPDHGDPSYHTLFTGKARRVMTFIEGRNNGDDGRAMAKVLTIVRTADERTRRVVPQEMLPRAGRGERGRERRGSLMDEDLFQGAAQYISNLESLWRQSLSENNTMQSVMSHYDREIEAKEEQIATLEAKVRRLNARVVQLERHTSSATVQLQRMGSPMGGL